MRRWRTSELHPSLHRLIKEIDMRRDQMTGGTPNGRYPKSELAMSAGLSSRQYHRYLRGEHLPTDEAGVERIILLAQNVGMERSEAESYLPEAISEVEGSAELYETSESLAAALRGLRQDVRYNGERADEILEQVKQTNSYLAKLVSHFTLI